MPEVNYYSSEIVCSNSLFVLVYLLMTLKGLYGMPEIKVTLAECSTDISRSLVLLIMNQGLLYWGFL